jgi:hypothetical protein
MYKILIKNKSWFHIRSYGGSDNGIIYSKYERKELSSKNSISSQTSKNEGESKRLSNEQKPREFVTSGPSLQEILKVVL